MNTRTPLSSISVSIPAGRVRLDGDLTFVQNARGLIIFVHGSGSSRFSPRNRHVAAVLNAGGFATLLADLLTPEEERVDVLTSHLRFDIPLLAGRTVNTVDWSREDEAVNYLPVGLFGASTGAAAAVIAATQRRDDVWAIVSRGGRVDLAGETLGQLHAPLLMIAGSRDTRVIALHEQAMPQLHCRHRFEVIPGASHLFEEPGTLDAVATLVLDWFTRFVTV